MPSRVFINRALYGICYTVHDSSQFFKYRWGRRFPVKLVWLCMVYPKEVPDPFDGNILEKRAEMTRIRARTYLLTQGRCCPRCMQNMLI